MGELTKFDNGSVDPETDTRFDKLPWGALLKAARAMKHGMCYEAEKPENWRGGPGGYPHGPRAPALRPLAVRRTRERRP
jgi:hypothetical protein